MTTEATFFAIRNANWSARNPKIGATDMRSIFLWALPFGAENTSTRSQWRRAFQPPDDEAAIRKTIEAYVEAYGKHDAEALAGLWSPEAVYTNRLTGEKPWGRAGLRAVKTCFKEQPESEARRGATESIQFLSPNVAVEQGSEILDA